MPREYIKFLCRLEPHEAERLALYGKRFGVKTRMGALRRLIKHNTPAIKKPPKPSLRDYQPGELAAQVKAMLEARMKAKQ